MKKLAVCLVLATLAACGSEEPAPVPTQAAAPAPAPSPSVPPPDQEVFAATYAEGCPRAAKVATSMCKSEGLGKDGFICDYRLGSEDASQRTTSIVPGDGKWQLADPDKACAA